MNNGKVRIYELSRELNLDNKDILGICDQLNISVKSHSSTITESEAERIRSAAEKYSDRQTAVASRDSASAEGPSSAKSLNRPDGQRKQQILEIRKPKARPVANTQSGTNVATPPQSPQPPSRVVAASPSKPTISRPMPIASKPEAKLDKEQEPELEPQQPEETEPSVASEETSEEKLQLVEPPSRPKRETAQLSQVERPLLKRDRPEAPVPEARSAPAPQRVRPAVGKQQPDSSGSSTEVRRPAPPSIPDLQRPQRRVKPSRDQELEVGASTDEDSEEELETVDSGELNLRRPTPPRLVKRKSWEEEEEEGRETAKPNKSGKLKRRTSLLDEEDEDFDPDASAETVSSVAVSLSVARPPKPKSASGASPVSPGPNISRGKKPPATRGDRSASKSDSRDRRREKKAVPERPDKLLLTTSLSIRELAEALEVAETEIIKKLFFKGMAVNITQTLDIPTAKMVAEELGVEVEIGEEAAAATKVTEMVDASDSESLQRRPPVVTIMGHVDHGKTTLLDAIRETKVAQGEAGGITQHIGAYHVDVEHEGRMQQVVFLDTPGHEAFTAMRARGTRVTDIAILVVAADDGVRPQTIEAISHAKAAGVPMVVAINKTDKAEAQPDRVKQELTEYGLVPEEWGGDTIMVPVSAIQRENLDTLLEMILLVSDIEDLYANPDRLAKGTVIEAHLDKARGPVASLLVQNGTLRVGDTLVAGSVLGKVRAMSGDRGNRVEAATPSFAVELLGLSDVPAAGDEFEVFANEKEARSVASDRSDEQRQSRLQQVMSSRRVTLNSLSAQAQEGDLKELNLVLKADVQGSLEAILGSLKQLPQNEVQIRVLLSAPGEISETDVDLAAASGAVVIGFNTTLATGARQSADRAGVDIREYNIIYKLLDDIQGAMEGLLDPEQVEEPLGQVEVRAVFPVGRGAVAGCYVLSGKAVRNCNIRVLRNGKQIYQGILDSLKRMKEDAKEVNAGFECGVGVDKFNDWQEGDIIETFKMVSKRRTLSAT
ncbi:MAG: translation initiation factor IF-2 [Kastovskya adunca ATA6-11-RM4]|jgi:translation initiation factor IF-2|nr:translation initiation factor IF-2 [Kastovskya adunca ATA6-11-RM4]